MSYLTQVAHQRPMLRVTAEIALVFCCAAPLVLAFSSLVGYGVSLMIPCAVADRQLPSRYPRVTSYSTLVGRRHRSGNRHHAKSVTTTVRVSITATVPNKVMGRTRLGFMSPSPDLTLIWSVYHFKLKWRPPKIS